MSNSSAKDIATGLDVSGTGTTVSIFIPFFFISFARFFPRFNLASYTEIPSMVESGRAKYTYSKMQGQCLSSEIFFVYNLPSVLKKTASPGRTSRSILYPSVSRTTLSDTTQ
jgi:hypothetical protein